MSGKLDLKQVSKGKYQLTATLDVELPFDPIQPNQSTTADPPTPSPEIKGARQQHGQDRLALTVEEVAELLGIGRDRVYHLLRTRELKSIKIGKLRRTPRTRFGLLR